MACYIYSSVCSSLVVHTVVNCEQAGCKGRQPSQSFPSCSLRTAETKSSRQCTARLLKRCVQRGVRYRAPLPPQRLTRPPRSWGLTGRADDERPATPLLATPRLSTTAPFARTAGGQRPATAGGQLSPLGRRGSHRDPPAAAMGRCAPRTSRPRAQGGSWRAASRLNPAVAGRSGRRRLVAPSGQSPPAVSLPFSLPPPRPSGRNGNSAPPLPRPSTRTQGLGEGKGGKRLAGARGAGERGWGKRNV